MIELHDKARDWQVLSKNTRYKGQVQEADEIIAELLAENERLNKQCEYWRDKAKEMAKGWDAAEARLRELASAEPVAWMDPNMPITMHHRNKALGVGPSCTIPLIRRPEMLS